MSAPDMTIVTSAIDFDTVLVAVVSVFAAFVVVYVIRKGIRFILDSVKGGDKTKRWEATMSQSDGIWFANNETGEVKFRPRR